MHTPSASRTMIAFVWSLQLIAAGILAQTLFFKFTGAPESRWIFGQLGVEPWGRYLAAVTELVTVVLLLVPSTAGLGAVMGLGVITGAIGAHLFKLGVEVQGDRGLLFALALSVWVACLGVAWIRRAQIPLVGPWVARSKVPSHMLAYPAPTRTSSAG